MSYKTWCNYGMGVKVDNNIETTLEKILDLIALAPDFKERFEDEVEDTVERIKERNAGLNNQGVDTPVNLKYIDRVMFELESQHTFGMAIAAVVNELEDVNVECVDDMDGNYFLIFPQRLPWAYNYKERNMSEQDVKDLFEKYLRYLTDQTLDELEYGYQEIENGG